MNTVAEEADRYIRYVQAEALRRDRDRKCVDAEAISLRAVAADVQRERRDEWRRINGLTR